MMCRLSFATFLFFCMQPTAFSAGSTTNDNIEALIDDGWGFTFENRKGKQAIVAVEASHLEQRRTREFIGSLSSLEELSICNSEFDVNQWDWLTTHSSRLKTLTLEGSRTDQRKRPNDKLLPVLLQLQHLRSLTLKHFDVVSNRTVSKAAPCRLDKLEVSGNLSGSLSQILPLFRPRELRIELHGRTNILSEADVSTLNEQPQLDTLTIIGDPFGNLVNINLDKVSGLINIKRLTLHYCICEPRELKRFPFLESLILRSCAFSRTSSFDIVFALPSLKKLTLWECNNEDLRVQGPYFKVGPALKTIVIHLPLCGDLSAFEKLPVTFDICIGQVTEIDGVEHCAKIGKNILRRVGNRELLELKSIRGLRSLSIQGPEVSITKSALTAMLEFDRLAKLELRSVKVEHDAEMDNQKKVAAHLQEFGLVRCCQMSGKILRKVIGKDLDTLAISRCSISGLNDSELRVFKLKRLTLHNSDPAFDAATSPLLDVTMHTLICNDCSINKESILQIARCCPSLKHLYFVECAFKDEDKNALLQLNVLNGLMDISFIGCDLSSYVATKLKAPCIRIRSLETIAP